jgi:hypothetical protein
VDAPCPPDASFSRFQSEPQHPEDVRNRDSSFAIPLCGVSVTYPQSAYKICRWCGIPRPTDQALEKQNPVRYEVYLENTLCVVTEPTNSKDTGIDPIHYGACSDIVTQGDFPESPSATNLPQII